MSQFRTEMHNRGMKDLSEFAAHATLACHGCALVSSAPGNLALPQSERQFVLLFPSGSAEVPYEPKKTEKTHTRPLG